MTFNLLSEAFDETFVPTTEVDTLSLNYNQIFNGTFFVWDNTTKQIEDEIVNISAGDSLGHIENGYLLNYTLYYTNETSILHLMNYSSTPGFYNYTIDNRTGNVTLLGWTMGPETNESINAYYNYTEVDWQRLIPKNDEGKYYYNLDSLNGTLSLNDWSLKVKYIETNDWNITVINTFKAFYNYTGLAPADEITASYKYRDGNKRLFNTDAVYGGGDWRFYYVEIPDGGLYKDPLTNFFVNLTWNSELADVDVITFGPAAINNIAPGDPEFLTDRYGPYTLESNGGSTETNSFFTATDGAQEYAISLLEPGLNVIGLHSVQLSAVNFESVQGQVGNIRLGSDEIRVVSNGYSGS
ncbi:MAG: hypothetical protein KAX31_06465, partial [Thermoplasmata archaeon]|nr:hypothetical protein [Thermoplasmata archaeon]